MDKYATRNCPEVIHIPCSKLLQGWTSMQQETAQKLFTSHALSYCRDGQVSNKKLPRSYTQIFMLRKLCHLSNRDNYYSHELLKCQINLFFSALLAALHGFTTPTPAYFIHELYSRNTTPIEHIYHFQLDIF